MTERFVKANNITLEILESMRPGDTLGPFSEGFLVNPKVPEGSANSGYPEAELTIRRFGRNEMGKQDVSDVYTPEGTYGIIDRLKGGGSQGPKAGGMTAEEVIEKLLTNDHCVPGEIRNKGGIVTYSKFNSLASKSETEERSDEPDI